MFTVREIFDLGIQIEENGERFYRQALDKVSDSSLKTLLEWLAEQEMNHADWFSTMKKSLGRSGDDGWVEQVSGALLQSSMKDRLFSLEEVDFSSIENEEALIRIAIEFEQDTIMFYEILTSFATDPEIFGHVNEIIREEQKHIHLLEERQKGLRREKNS